jgi:iron complex outermembrane recepter protein
MSGDNRFCSIEWGKSRIDEGGIMKHDSLRLSLSVSVFALALPLTSPAFAQDAPAPAPAPDTQESVQPAAQQPAPIVEGGVEDIVVTARKRAESVQDVPVSVTAFSAELVENRDITSIEKIAAATPSLNVGRASNGSGAQLTMRGIGSSSTSIGIEQSVATVVDGVYYGQGRIINEGFFDLAGVEVLKGPQALFFGKNATAGVISIKTADPTDSWEYKARASYEFKSEQVQLEGVASGPLTDTLGVRVAVRGSKMYGGYYRNVADPVTYTTVDIQDILAGSPVTPVGHVASPAARKAPGEKELLGRVTLQWEPTERLTATLKASGSHNEVNNSSWNYVAFNCGLPTGLSQLTGQPCDDNKFVTHQNNIPTDIAANFPFSKNDGDLYNRYRSAAVTGSVNYTLEDVTFTSVTNYNWNNNRWACACDFQSSPAGTWATENSSWKAFSSEFRALTTFDGPFNVMLGALYQKTKRDFDQFIMFANLSNSAASPENEFLATTKTSFTKGETLAGFGQVTWKIMESLELAGGVRYTHETKDSFFTQPYNNPGLTFIFRDQNDPDGLGVITADQEFSDWSPEASLTWKPNRNILVYGAFKTAYKSGGFSNGGINSKFSSNPLADLTFEPEKARGFEAGVKTTLFDRQLRFNVGAYNYKYQDLQVDFFNSPIFAFQTLTADARTKGIEVEFEWAPRAFPGLNLRGSVDYNKARYTSFPLGPCYAGQTPEEGCNLAFNPAIAAFTRQKLSGKPLSVAPEWVGAFGMSYEGEISAALKYGFNFDVRFSDDYIVSGFGAPHSRQDSYATLDAGFRIGPADDRWEIALIGKNLTNEQYFSGVVDGPSTGSGTGTPAGIHADQLGFGTIPRTVRLQGTVRF